MEVSKIYKYKCPICEHIQYSNRPPKEIEICDNCGKVDLHFVAININCLIPNSIARIISEELVHRTQVDNIGESLYEWTTKDGKTLNLREMTDTHLKNILNLLQERYGNNVSKQGDNYDKSR